ncbi:hypothetical protein KAH81_02035 [bacterium]|nr:hypothetical protein [bacterium]
MIKENRIFPVIFWGALWGIAEATLGLFFHAIKPLGPWISGAVMFPIGFYFMHLAFTKTGKIHSMFGVAVIASAIKLVNLVVPGLSPVSTINPTIAIMLEGASVALVYRFVDMKKPAFVTIPVLVMSLGWRVLFVGYLAVVASNTGLLSVGTWSIAKFLVVDMILNSLLISAYLIVSSRKAELGGSNIRIQPAVSILTLVLAVIIQFGVKLI